MPPHHRRQLVPPAPPQPFLTLLESPSAHRCYRSPGTTGQASRGWQRKRDGGQAVKLENVSLPAPSPSCRDQLSQVANLHCNPSCPPFCRLGQFLESWGFALLSFLISSLQLPQRAGLAGWWGQREVDFFFFFGSFGTVWLAPCDSLRYCHFARQAALQRLILPAANGCSCPISSPFLPSTVAALHSPPPAAVIIYTPKHPLSFCRGRGSKEKAF